MEKLRWTTRAALFGLIAMAVQTPLSAAVIVGYTSDNSPTTAAAAEWLTGVTPLPLSRGSGLSAGSGATFNSTGWTNEPTDYLEWGWLSSQALNLTDLDLRYDRSTSGPSGLSIAISVNGAPYQTIFNDALVSDVGEDVLDVDLSDFLNVTSATFRLFGSGATSGTGTFDIESMTGVSPARGIVVNGVAAVPEPDGLSMFASAGGLFALRVLRRRRRA